MEQVSETSEKFLELKRQVLDRVDLSREVPDEEMQDLIDEVSVMLYQNREKEALDQLGTVLGFLKEVSGDLLDIEGTDNQQIAHYISLMYQNLNDSYKYKDMLGIADCLQEYALSVIELYKAKVGQGIK